MRPLITFISDYGLKDYFVASYKATIINRFQEASVVDITHQIAPYSLDQAVYNWVGFARKIANPSFHYILVNAEWSPEQEYLILKKQNHYVLVADNGFAWLANFYTTFDSIYKLKSIGEKPHTFAIYQEITRHLLEGNAIETIASECTLEDTHKIQLPKCEWLENKNMLKFSIIYEDEFGNSVTNILYNEFEKLRRNRSFELKIGMPNNINEVHTHYSKQKDESLSNKGWQPGDLYLMVNDMGFLQISMYKSSKRVGTVESLVGLKNNPSLYIKFM